jgi:hypothetical protein
MLTYLFKIDLYFCSAWHQLRSLHVLDMCFTSDLYPDPSCFYFHHREKMKSSITNWHTKDNKYHNVNEATIILDLKSSYK